MFTSTKSCNKWPNCLEYGDCSLPLIVVVAYRYHCWAFLTAHCNINYFFHYNLFICLRCVVLEFCRFPIKLCVGLVGQSLTRPVTISILNDTAIVIQPYRHTDSLKCTWSLFHMILTVNSVKIELQKQNPHKSFTSIWGGFSFWITHTMGKWWSSN